MSVDHSAQSGHAPIAERRMDLYETPECAVRALLEVEAVPPGAIWEPACGPGAIVRVLAGAGHRVYATDLVNYDSPHQDDWGIDFLLAWQLPGVASIGSIITNPPYMNADAFVRHALTFGVAKVCMLLRLAFLESARRTVILEESGLARVHVFRNRLPMMHRSGFSGNKGGSAIAFAWFVWERGYSGRPELNRISWK